MKNFRYQLLGSANCHLVRLPSGKKIRCPQCGQKRMTPVVDTETGQLCSGEYGRCDRLNECRYLNIPGKKTEYKPPQPEPEKPMMTISSDIVQQTIDRGHSTFSQWLVDSFGDAGQDATRTYRLGVANKPWPGATIFWQIDRKGRARSGKIMGYQVVDGVPKRVREPKPQMTWVHSLMKAEGELKQCLFGLHLLGGKPVGVVESEKTAVIASIFHPELTWMATGGSENLRADLMAPLAGHQVLLFPDADHFRQWGYKLEYMPFLNQVEIIDYGGQKQQDPADVLLETGAGLEFHVPPQFEDPEPAAVPQPSPQPRPPQPPSALEKLQVKNPAFTKLLEALDLQVESIQRAEPKQQSRHNRHFRQPAKWKPRPSANPWKPDFANLDELAANSSYKVPF